MEEKKNPPEHKYEEKKTHPSTNIPSLSYRNSKQQHCSYQGKALEVPTAF